MWLSWLGQLNSLEDGVRVEFVEVAMLLLRNPSLARQ